LLDRSKISRFVDDRSIPEQMFNMGGIAPRECRRGFAPIAGISKYPHLKDLSDLVSAGEDVRKLVNHLISYGKFDEAVVLKDARHRGKF
jgi:hypothetical protein